MPTGEFEYDLGSRLCARAAATANISAMNNNMVRRDAALESAEQLLLQANIRNYPLNTVRATCFFSAIDPTQCLTQADQSFGAAA
jgi:hypothetical protein